MIADHRAAGKPVSVMMMDLDKFKQINDSFGHDVGDRVLKSVADVLRATLRHNDAIARIGGDEFAAALPNVDRIGAMEIAERIMQVASEQYVRADANATVPLKLSIGICDNTKLSSAEEMLKSADKAMYLAKGKADAPDAG